jgi:hypothetical protein
MKQPVWDWARQQVPYLTYATKVYRLPTHRSASPTGEQRTSPLWDNMSQGPTLMIEQGTSSRRADRKLGNRRCTPHRAVGIMPGPRTYPRSRKS